MGEAAKAMKSTSILSILATACFTVLYRKTGSGLCFSLAITAGTIAYHFTMRLLVGEGFYTVMKNKADLTKKWYQVGKAEMKLYRKLKVKQWKDKMPTYNADWFDPSKHSWEEIAQTMCQAELVHETNAVLSLLPIAASVWFGSLGVFVITSVLGAMLDLLFVCMQRFNRARILKLAARKPRSMGVR